MKEVSDYRGNKFSTECLSCARENRTIRNLGHLVTTKFFDAHQDFEVPIEGFIIVSSRRHLTSIDELTEEELSDFIQLIAKLRKAQRQVLNIESVYIIQKEGKERHLHFWLLPRYPWMDEKFGTKLESVTQAVEYAKAHDKSDRKTKAIEEYVSKLKGFIEQQYFNL